MFCWALQTWLFFSRIVDFEIGISLMRLLCWELWPLYWFFRKNWSIVRRTPISTLSPLFALKRLLSQTNLQKLTFIGVIVVILDSRRALCIPLGFAFDVGFAWGQVGWKVSRRIVSWAKVLLVLPLKTKKYIWSNKKVTATGKKLK